MHHFDYRDGVLHAEGVDLSTLAEVVGTPFYCYSTATLERHYRVFAEAFAGTDHLVCYAVKANSNQSVLRTMAKLGAGADVVSGGELKRALAAEIPASKASCGQLGVCTPPSVQLNTTCKLYVSSDSASMVSPLKAVSTPAMMRNRVLLPAPLRPMTPILAP